MTSTKDEVSTCEEYFQLTKQHKASHGERAIVLMQVGIFFEIYGFRSSVSGKIEGSDIEEICDACDLACGERKMQYKKQPMYMAGFTISIMDKYLDLLIKHGFTVAVYLQTDEINPKTKKVVRKLDTIYSSSTYVSMDPKEAHQLNNHIMTLWVMQGSFRRNGNKKQEGIVYGTSLLNVFNGHSHIYEHWSTDRKIQCNTFDELEKHVSIFRPSEIVIISNFDATALNKLQQFTGITQGGASVHCHTTDSQEAVNCSKQTYLKHMLTHYFGDAAWESCEEFHRYPYAVQAFVFLLHFVEMRNANLIKRIEMPVFHNQSQKMLLANHTLRQLNIINDHSDDGAKKGQLSSVSSFLNKCVTAMGKRKFQYLITHPSFDEAWLLREYDAMKRMLDPETHRPIIDPLRKQMQGIRDLEKMSRLLCNQKLTPQNMYQLYNSVGSIEQIYTCMMESPELQTYLTQSTNTEATVGGAPVGTQATAMLRYIESKLQLSHCESINTITSFERNIIQRGVSSKLDDTLDQLDALEAQLATIETYFNRLYMEAAKPKTPVSIIKVNRTEKNGISLQVTKTRSDFLLKHVNQKDKIELDNGVAFEWKEVRFPSANKSTHEVYFPLLESICKHITEHKNQLNAIIQEVYLSLLTEFENTFHAELDTVCGYVSRLDVLLSKCHCAVKYRYHCPTLATTNEYTQSFVKATDMRHVLIEQLQQDELYVANDLTIGLQDIDGILLYGTNAVGKTSYIRATGICVIMAQAGMYVPCKTFHYKPYQSIYSRIIGNDNLFKGLSTYAVEISELRTILNTANENSLVLGDELCSGTETVSAMSVVMGSLIKLSSLRTSFILATHFHELVSYDELKALPNVVLQHMEVWYDAENDCLVYDRKIKSGSGQRTYGLEVCKSLYFPEDVLTDAYRIRRKYHPEFQGALSQKTSRYNAKKIRDKCEQCGSTEQLEVHHLQEQHQADQDGYIDDFHKNHPANLLTLCEKCHDQFHHQSHDQDQNQDQNQDQDETSNVSPLTHASSIRTKRVVKTIKKKTTKGMMLQEVEVA